MQKVGIFKKDNLAAVRIIEGYFAVLTSETHFRALLSLKNCDIFNSKRSIKNRVKYNRSD